MALTVTDSQISSAMRRVENAARKKSSALKRQTEASAKAVRLRGEAQRTNSESLSRSKLSQADREEQSSLRAQNDLLRYERDYNKYSSELEKLRTRRQQESDQRQARALAELLKKNKELQRHFAVPNLQSEVALGQPPAKQFDFFISHASEDKDEIARPLKDALESLGASVWFDELNITVGQSIRREIEKGLTTCQFGVVIVSEYFFRKQWTQMELDALFAKKVESGRDLVLPIWHKVTKDQVNAASPFLAGVHALNSSIMTVEEMACELHRLTD